MHETITGVPGRRAALNMPSAISIKLTFLSVSPYQTIFLSPRQAKWNDVLTVFVNALILFD